VQRVQDSGCPPAGPPVANPQFGGPRTMFNPRQLQFSLKYSFYELSSRNGAGCAIPRHFLFRDGVRHGNTQVLYFAVRPRWMNCPSGSAAVRMRRSNCGGSAQGNQKHADISDDSGAEPA
jgi:hypothetical protein